MEKTDEEFWREKVDCKLATFLVLLFILLWHTLTLIKNKKNNNNFNNYFHHRFRSVSSTNQSQIIRVSSSTLSSQTRISATVSDADLKNLINNLDGIFDQEMKWDDVINKTSNRLSYNAKCYKPKNGPLAYMSVTIFENCSVERLRDFYMDNEYRLQWDKTMVDHKQLQIDETNGTEVGRTVKKFPLLTPREYVLAWRLWKGKDNTFYCFTKECEHTLAPRLKKYVRVGYFRSGWRISKVPGRNACEIKMVHQEDAGLNVEMAKLVFSKGIWSYVNKMDAALQKYNPTSTLQSTAVMTAVTLMQKVPPELDSTTTNSRHILECTSSSAFDRQEPEIKGKTLSRRPSKKMIANGLLLLGGVLCLSRGHSSLGAKIAMGCVLKKLTKHTTSSSQAGPAC
ncbi:hypothetical protein AQUCO_01800192v1 [Aquilegia coerulea]|uniref:START domain-containing protein n=1 Tax=Aquilegia coerulea TaxID=218851 RepID=A0A2G5DKF4_AQUCA|nr:hypothetical protein AQUCO_01800192v1 [Aquilegia coerulea]